MRILQIGCGGIGSWLADEVAFCYQQEQIETDVEYWIADNDRVELAQIKYQNFTEKDIGKNKAKAFNDRWGFYVNSDSKRVTDEKQLKDFDLFILCVDNTKTRELVYRYCHLYHQDFIDLRAEGKQIFAKEKGIDGYADMGTLNLADKENGSCQVKADLERGIIQKGNKIVAMIGIQMLLNYLRKEKNRTIVLNL